jgi:CRISPR-associated endonuclease/helicase Cas3
LTALAHPGQTLLAHLQGVAGLAAEFAAAFGSREQGFVAGLWHDLGKYRPEFQRRLAGEPIQAEHSGIGAAWASGYAQSSAAALAFVIAGHHTGLTSPCGSSVHSAPRPLSERLNTNKPRLAGLTFPDEVRLASAPELPAFCARRPQTPGELRRLELWIRFLFSALTDADYLDTEKAVQPARACVRLPDAAPGSLVPLIETAIAKKGAELTEEARLTAVNRARQDLSEACRTAADWPPGFFSLFAPTGSGKTLASMRFALRHAATHGLGRVIVVLPYTSIIEQNAEAYRAALGAGHVIEHHSNYDPPEHAEEIAEPWRLACENWDAPIIVTTTVQFFESLFSNRTSRCRKLHRIARSVVILDEVQSLPPEFLAPTTEALGELVRNYNCSVLLSTATPPALERRPSLPVGIENIRPIVADPAALAERLERVHYHWPTPGGAAMSWEELTGALAGTPRALAILHLRKDARELAGLVREHRPVDPLFHLSALMCPAHRSAVLDQVRTTLRGGGPCRLVATQLVEAGVDLDFPVVYRALGGLDSMVQAAGRCNREGRPEPGDVFIFRAPTGAPRGTPRRGLEIMEQLLASGAVTGTPSPEACLEYFRRFYFASDLDARGLQKSRAALDYPKVAHDYRLIEDECTESVVVPYGEAPPLVAKTRNGGGRDALRRLQRYQVSVYRPEFDRLLHAGALDEIVPGLHALTPPFAHLYDAVYGLVTGDDPQPSPECLTI